MRASAGAKQAEAGRRISAKAPRFSAPVSVRAGALKREPAGR